jgi:hypothetical protein
MECFIVEDGVERKAELEDILPLIDEKGIQNNDFDEALQLRKNLALAKKNAIKMIYEGYNPRIILSILLAYFDDDVTENTPELILD